MNDYRLEVVEYNGIACLHVMAAVEVNQVEVHAYVPLNAIADAAFKQGYAIYAMPDKALQQICETWGYTKKEVSHESAKN